MSTTLRRKYGNSCAELGDSLAIRIPKLFVNQIGLEPNSPVKLSFRDMELVITSARPPDLKLANLLAQVTEDNLHGEVDPGAPVGHENPDMEV